MSPLQPTTLPGRGRSLITTRPINPGEVLLSYSPLLLYATTTPSSFCSHCFRTLFPPKTLSCPSCPSNFCSPLCLSHHPPLLCHSLPRLPLQTPPNLLFLLSAYSLSISHPQRFQQLLSLFGDPGPADHLEASQLHSLLCQLHPDPLPPGFSVTLTASLLAKDRFNSFGLMEPFHGKAERKVRAYGVYPNAALFNHDCLPNACRFDYLDGDGERNTDIVVRALHEIREGQEVCLSYFPVNWRYAERQKRLLEDYGFLCECDRCRVEKEWKDDDDGDAEVVDDDMEEEAGNDGDEGMEMNDEGNDAGDFPHVYFFVRYLCDKENCGGTMAPSPPSPEGTISNVLECNVCGQLRKEDDDTCNGGDDSDGGMIDN